MKYFKNYLITIAGRVAGAVAAFLSLPILLEHLGSGEYNLIAFASLVQGYANILDAGLSPALAANVARHSEHRDQALNIITAAIRSSIIKFSKYALPLLAPLIATACVTLPDVLLERLTLFCVILLLDAFVSAVFRLQYSALQGFGDHAVANGMHTLNIVIRTTVGVGIAVQIGQIEYIYIAQSLITLVAILANFSYFRLRRFRPPSAPARDFVTDQSGVPLDLTVIAIFLAVINSIPLIVLGRLGNSNELNHYFLAASLGGIVATLQGSLISVLIPSLSQEIAKAPLDNRRQDFRRMSRNVVCVSFVLGGLAFCLAEPIVSVWIRKAGVDRMLITTLFRFQLISAAFVSLTIVPYALSIPMRQTRIQLIGVGLYLLACCIVMPLARYFGNIELFALMAMLLGLCFSTGYFLASSYLIRPKARPPRIWIFIAEPVPYIAIALIVAWASGKMLSHAMGSPSWPISIGIYSLLICGIFLYASKGSLSKFKRDGLCPKGRRPL